ncbi:hypothetical protein [Burkholderia ubonensis]|uniref:hypothetical protein n=1 Tax=Burkholderia ubonensis TaxID=101571 RepID=UPI000BA5427E|nr:hypothetical protein [Burkholderia ubonensis]PAJ88489.1 hypothetical protein CJO70_06680 [Burkholderia ubonensis]PAJ94974.1 hypothetical protein CJO69_08695 [Burkholderia ubonensis]PAK08890.1 hypothetical protein CJO67_06055 [Burkholderia ubonensis]RQP72065.1 hypothetical protein DF013_20550 [Burkholderia ubonensis]RQP82967.1 hypothetical protein DF014_17580 [Burkholderia ubonensis]
MAFGSFPNGDGQRRATRLIAEPAPAPRDDLDALLALARQAGLLVTLDGQIGREKYQSIVGSVAALQRFAAALRQQAAVAAPAPSPMRRASRRGHVRVSRTRRFSPCRACPLETARHRAHARHGGCQRRSARPGCVS